MLATDATAAFPMKAVEAASTSPRLNHDGSLSAEASPDRCSSGAISDASEPQTTANADIELSRRAVPVIEADEDVCSVCLDNYTQEDPGNQTTCGHFFHLQCIMQWAQRSRECPLCFKPLQLQDAALNELLPFGEYVAPQRFSNSNAHVLMGLDAWELERLLHRLATNSAGGTSLRRERRSRSRGHFLAGGSEDRGHRIRASLQAAEGAPLAGSARAGSEDAGASSSMLPSSWPPHSRNSSASPEPGQDGRAADNLRSRWAAVSNRCRESLSKTTRELKGRWGGSTHRNGSSGEHSDRPDNNGTARPSSSSS